MNLDDDTLVWHQSYLKCMNLSMLPAWDKYIPELIELFGEEFANPMLELKQLRQTGTVREFQFAFDRLLARCSLTIEQAISCFLGGLKEELVHPIKMHEPKSLSKTYWLARLAEVTLAANARALKHTSPWSYSSVRKSVYDSTCLKSYQPMQLTRLNSPANSTSIIPKTRRNIFPAEMQSRRAQGLCYFCDDKFTPRHKCTLPNQMFVLELEVAEDEFVDTGTGVTK